MHIRPNLWHTGLRKTEIIRTFVSDNMSNLVNQLSQLLDARKINPQTTIAQLVGGKYNNNKFGTMSGMMGNQKSQLRKRGYTGSF